MVEGTFLLLAVLAVTYFEQAKQSIRKQELLDLAYLEGYSLDDERAERAVRAGHGDLLEKRIRSGGKVELPPEPDPDAAPELAEPEPVAPRA
jgi:hypothetical protein